MIHIKRILFPTDFSRCASQAFEHATFIANKYHAELHVFHATVLRQNDPHDASFHVEDIESLGEKLKKLAHSKIASMAETVKGKNVNLKKVVRRGFSPASEILKYADEFEFDFIIMGIHKSGKPSRPFLGSVAEEVVRSASCHIFTVRESETPKPLDKRERILVPMDFSEHSVKALSYAKEIASIYRSELHILHVIEEPLHPAFYTTGKTSIFKLDPHIVKRSQKECKQLLQDAPGPDVKASIHISEGHAFSEISKFSQDLKTDLIVIATHGLTGIKHLLLGRVAENTIRRTDCPIFIVKAFGKSLLG